MKTIAKIAFILTLFFGSVWFAGEYYETPLGAQSAPKFKLGDPLPENLFVEMAKAINPSVVNISTARMPQRPTPRRGMPRDPFFDMFEQFLGPQTPVRPQQALGTGFIIKSNGLILTNNHVIQGADVIRVQLSEKGDTFHTAEVIGRDQRTDIALIKIDAKSSLPAVSFGDSDKIQVGEWVAAFGNPFGHGHTLTKGIVSAIGREIDELNRFPFIQTDASINPGNSGGPLVNSKGEVVGVNTAIDARAQGIGFAIPINNVKSILPQLEKEGIIRRAFLGINMYPYPVNPQAAQEMGLPSTTGALIVGVVPNGPADKAGLKEYDFVTRFNGKKVENSEDLRILIADSAAGKSYTVEYFRGGKKLTSKVTLGENPEDKVRVTQTRKTYRGQKAPFELGFTVTNLTSEIAKNFNLPKLRGSPPVVIDVEFDSPAAKSGLIVGDVILDVNRVQVSKDIQVLSNLKEKQINSLRVLRGTTPILIYISRK